MLGQGSLTILRSYNTFPLNFDYKSLSRANFHNSKRHELYLLCIEENLEFRTAKQFLVDYKHCNLLLNKVEKRIVSR